MEEGEEFDLNRAQKIFGYFDKSQLINLFQLIFSGNEKEVLKLYRSIFDQGIEPKIFLNDFLEILYYFKNINSLTIDGNNFSLNDEEHKLIKKLSNEVEPNTLLLFWQFAIKTLGELDIVNNQNLSIEMFLIRLIHLKKIKNDITHIETINNKLEDKNIILGEKSKIDDNGLLDLKNKTIGQIKNVIQEKKKTEIINDTNLQIKTFENLIDLCNTKKEIKLKHELETNVNLVSFENKRIEISFNERLDKEFIKNLSSKLYEWTNDRWIISLSKENGMPSKKEKEVIEKKELFEKIKKSKIYEKVLKKFPDAELIDIEPNLDKKND